VPAPTRRS